MSVYLGMLHLDLAPVKGNSRSTSYMEQNMLAAGPLPRIITGTILAELGNGMASFM